MKRKMDLNSWTKNLMQNFDQNYFEELEAFTQVFSKYWKKQQG